MSRTILLADDSLTIQKVVELTFTDTEYEVVAVSSGDDLLQRLPEVRPDLVICDVIMPGRDGYEAAPKSLPNHSRRKSWSTLLNASRPHLPRLLQLP